MPKAIPQVYFKQVFADEAIPEITVLSRPAANPERPHGLKYSLFHGKNRSRLVGHDNERGKGDRRHIGPIEEPYVFTALDRLIADFHDDVRRMRQRT